MELVGELQLTTLEYLELKKVQHKFYTIKRAFQAGKATPAEAHDQSHFEQKHPTPLFRDI